MQYSDPEAATEVAGITQHRAKCKYRWVAERLFHTDDWTRLHSSLSLHSLACFCIDCCVVREGSASSLSSAGHPRLDCSTSVGSSLPCGSDHSTRVLCCRLPHILQAWLHRTCGHAHKDPCSRRRWLLLGLLPSENLNTRLISDTAHSGFRVPKDAVAI